MTALTRLPPLSTLHDRSHLIVRLVGWCSNLLLQRWCKSVRVEGLERLVNVIKDEKRITQKRGVLTYANHISVLDDPTLFGGLPSELFQQSKTTRWTMGASDIMFTNSFNAYIFRSGQVLPTDRGRGVFQPALDHSIEIMQNGGWVHIFPEGYVNMSRQARVRRFKWGIGRMLLETGLGISRKLPVILPIWITGLDGMMPEPRGNPKWMPRPGADVTITFGYPVNESIDPIIERAKEFALSTDMISKENNESSHTLIRSLEGKMEGIDSLAQTYPIPEKSLFSPTTPLTPPPGGVSWPLPLEDSRSFNAIQSGLDSDRARIARSFISAELRAHLVKLGDETGSSKDLIHRLMPEE